MPALLTGFAICSVNYAVFIFVKLSIFKHFSCRADVTITKVVIGEFVMIKGRVAIAVWTLMADAWRYALLVKMLVILSDAVGFVSHDSFNFCGGVCFMLVDNFD